MAMNIAVVPGTFDPVHYGHIDVMESAAKLFDKVYWLVAENPDKKTHYGLYHRSRMMDIVIKTREIYNVEVRNTNKLVIDACSTLEATHIVRSFRMTSDFEYEMQLAMVNRKLDTKVETIYIASKQEHLHISSTAIRLLLEKGKNVSEYMPPECMPFLLGD